MGFVDIPQSQNDLDDLECLVMEGQTPPARSNISHEQWIEYLDADRECNATNGNDEEIPQLVSTTGETVVTVESDDNMEDENETQPVSTQ